MALATQAIDRLTEYRTALITAATLFQQTWRASFLRPADQRNPYAYVHSSPDVLKFRPLADAALARAPDRPVRVIAEEYWPLPWYLRSFGKIGYWPQPSADLTPLPVVFAMPETADATAHLLQPTHTPLPRGLRADVPVTLFVRNDIWNSWMKNGK